jgi:type IV pilus assembly protein PilN
MAHINLLPWRAELRKQKQREFATVAVGSAILMLLVIAFFHFQISGMIDHQNSRNSFLQREIETVEAQIKEIRDLEVQKQQLVARMKVIEQLQRDRPAVVHLFDELVKATPDGLYLTSVLQENSTLVIEGIAQSNARVSALMRNLEASPWLENPVLEIIQSDKSESSRSFKLRVVQSFDKAKK